MEWAPCQQQGTALSTLLLLLLPDCRVSTQQTLQPLLGEPEAGLGTWVPTLMVLTGV